MTSRAAKMLRQLRRDQPMIYRRAQQHFIDSLDPTKADGNGLWSERTRRDVYALEAVRLFAGDERAKAVAETPKMLGVVFIPQRVEDRGQWELQAANADKPVIEAVAKEPDK